LASVSAASTSFPDRASARGSRSRSTGRLRDAYQRVVENALDLMRPAGGHWAVTMAETATTVRLDFARGTDTPRSLTIASDGDDEKRSQLFHYSKVNVEVSFRAHPFQGSGG